MHSVSWSKFESKIRVAFQKYFHKTMFKLFFLHDICKVMYFQIVHCYSIARVKLLHNLYEIDKEEKNEVNIKCILGSCKHYFVKILMSNSDFFCATKE